MQAIQSDSLEEDTSYPFHAILAVDRDLLTVHLHIKEF